MPSFSLTVPSGFAGRVRLDKYVAGVEGGMNRSRLKSGMTALTVNGRAAKLSSKVGAGDHIQLDWEDSVPCDIAPEAIPLDILYEDDNVTVVNKRQGMVTHPASGNWSGTLVNALLYHWGRAAVRIADDSASPVPTAAHRPGIVHRLDKDTSGVIITAKNRDAEEWLCRQFKERRLSKLYIAIVTGRPKDWRGEIQTKLVRDSRDRKRFTAAPLDGKAGKYAHTSYRCIAVYTAAAHGGTSGAVYSLLVLRLHTGRTHQIRVHLKHIGCPILGDSIYGKPTAGTVFHGATLMLHARRLALRLPHEKAVSRFTAPVPRRFRAVLRVLHRKFVRTAPPEVAFHGTH